MNLNRNLALINTLLHHVLHQKRPGIFKHNCLPIITNKLKMNYKTMTKTLPEITFLCSYTFWKTIRNWAVHCDISKLGRSLRWDNKPCVGYNSIIRPKLSFLPFFGKLVLVVLQLRTQGFTNQKQFVLLIFSDCSTPSWPSPSACRAAWARRR